MKLDFKGMLVIFVAFGVVTITSYMMGVSQGEKSENPPSLANRPAALSENKKLPAAHPQVDPATSARMAQAVSTSVIPTQKKRKSQSKIFSFPCWQSKCQRYAI